MAEDSGVEMVCDTITNQNMLLLNGWDDLASSAALGIFKKSDCLMKSHLND
jgi:hypothetical protein